MPNFTNCLPGSLRKLVLVRADVARLPFATGSLAAIHAGAAVHCWPDPTAAVRHPWHYGMLYLHCFLLSTILEMPLLLLHLFAPGMVSGTLMLLCCDA